MTIKVIPEVDFSIFLQHNKHKGVLWIFPLQRFFWKFFLKWNIEGLPFFYYRGFIFFSYKLLKKAHLPYLDYGGMRLI